ncbi:PLDc N-terminal domain-containing protein [Arthrobacter mobilis]|uniref:Cardiolipin synthase N-terminal domain-containing protein n=1 Tax=Arthrobacter mobilis TaxID=2724944 RepID=A0A7X6HE45_9MICC|nr:PLDc N-terminal domain-containing protein [Arthrobacter mobilis]NKX55482.1 hypothetical protein [Arthrobacter mobilis]
MSWDDLFWLPAAVSGGLFTVLLAAGTLVSVLRSESHDRAAKAAWAAVVLLAPVLGPVLWLALLGSRPSRC